MFFNTSFSFGLCGGGCGLCVSCGGGRADSAAPGELISWFELTHQPLVCSRGAMLEQRAVASVMSLLCDVTAV